MPNLNRIHASIDTRRKWSIRGLSRVILIGTIAIGCLGWSGFFLAHSTALQAQDSASPISSDTSKTDAGNVRIIRGTYIDENGKETATELITSSLPSNPAGSDASRNGQAGETSSGESGHLVPNASARASETTNPPKPKYVKAYEEVIVYRTEMVPELTFLPNGATFTHSKPVRKAVALKIPVNPGATAEERKAEVDVYRLADEFRQGSGDDKTNKRKLLNAAIERLFDLHHARQSGQIEKLAAELEEAKRIHLLRAQSKSSIVARRFNELLQQPDPLAWNGPSQSPSNGMIPKPSYQPAQVPQKSPGEIIGSNNRLLPQIENASPLDVRPSNLIESPLTKPASAPKDTTSKIANSEDPQPLGSPANLPAKADPTTSMSTLDDGLNIRLVEAAFALRDAIAVALEIQQEKHLPGTVPEVVLARKRAVEKERALLDVRVNAIENALDDVNIDLRNDKSELKIAATENEQAAMLRRSGLLSGSELQLAQSKEQVARYRLQRDEVKLARLIQMRTWIAHFEQGSIGPLMRQLNSDDSKRDEPIVAGVLERSVEQRVLGLTVEQSKNLQSEKLSDVEIQFLPELNLVIVKGPKERVENVLKTIEAIKEKKSP